MEVGREGRRGVLVRPPHFRAYTCFSPPPPPPDVLFLSSAEIQLHRLMKRDNSTREDASARLNSQLPITEKIKYADVVIDNSGTPQELEREIGAVIKRLRDDAGWSWRLSWLFPPWGVASAAWMLSWRALRRSQRHKSHKR